MSLAQIAPVLWTVGLGAVAAAVGWLIRAVLGNGRRIAAMEAEVRSLHVRDEIVAVHRRVDDVATTAASVEGQLRQLNQTMGIVHAHLLDGGG